MTAKPFTSVRSRAALDLLKDHVREHVPPQIIDGAALQHVGADEDKIDAAVRSLVTALRETMHGEADPKVSRPMRLALPFAAGELVRARIKELGRGGRA